MRSSKSAVLAAALVFFAACASGAGGFGCALGSSREAGPTRILLNATAQPPTIDVVDVSEGDLAPLRAENQRIAKSGPGSEN